MLAPFESLMQVEYTLNCGSWRLMWLAFACREGFCFALTWIGGQQPDQMHLVSGIALYTK